MIGKTLAHYEITALLGKGGMGEVYRATDTQLGRDVALKVLPKELADDAERLARFRREARTLASLHHQRIASLFGLEEVDGMTILVMELVEGQDLSERLEQAGALPVEDVIAIAIQIAEGLEFAHDHHVMHRDLKPANIKLTPQGDVKLLDFGLARAFTGEAIDESDIANSPTITAALTQVGVILGTAAYMSPEQAKGKSVDRRADIWSYGVVLFELLSGERLFQGETASETMADVMKSEIDWARLPARTPAALRSLLKRCLDRDPATRLRDIGEARIALSAPGSGEVSSAASPTPAASARAPWAVAILAAVVAIGALLWATARAPEATAPTSRTQADLMAGPGLGFDVSEVHLEVSSDGTQLAYTALDAAGERWIYVRNLASGEIRRIDGTQDGEYPFWSPDGTRLGFFAAGGISIVGVDDGIVERNIARLSSWALDAAWHPDGWIMLMSNDSGAKMHRVDVGSGEMQLVHTIEEWECAFSNPDVLPDGAILYAEDHFDSSNESGIYLFENGERRQLLERATNPSWVESLSAIVYRREQRIFAQPFDPVSKRFTGDPVRIGGPVRTKTFPNLGFLTVADDGTLIYLEGEAGASDSELVWVDRQGNVVDEPGIVGDLYSMDISHDGRRVAYDSSTSETAGDIWVYDFGRRSSLRLTDHRLDESGPQWMPGDEFVYFFRGADVCRVRATGLPEVELLLADGVQRRPSGIDPRTGTVILERTVGNDRDLTVFDPATGEESDWLALPGSQRYATFSPDGQWVAFHSDHDADEHVWIEKFPDRSERFRVSNDEGGRHPEWRFDGRELYYLSPSRKLMAVPIDMDATDENPIGEPKELFPVRLRRNLYYDVGPEPDRFLLNRLVGAAAAPSAVIVRGWSLDAPN